MPALRNDLLNPIPGENPSGINLRYSAIFDEIKKERSEDDDSAPMGEWQRQSKKADFLKVINLAGETLANRSKDLQLAAWLSEALIRRDGFQVLPECIELFLNLQERFWDALYPPIEDGDPELRATPQEWFAARCDYLLRRVPLTRNGLDWIRYRESCVVGYEQDTGTNEEKQRARQEAIEEGKITAEEFDDGFSGTPKAFYQELSATLDSGLEMLAKLDAFCDEKYGRSAPNFAKLRGVLEDLKQTVHVLLARKRELEPDIVAEHEMANEIVPEQAGDIEVSSTTSDISKRKDRSKPFHAPSSMDEAIGFILTLADYLAEQNADNTVPFLVRRAVRWGELRSQGESPDPASLIAPSSELRQELKSLYSNGRWEHLLTAAETAVASPCGRAWLDLQRYSWQACNELCYSCAAAAICSATRSLLMDYPRLSEWTLVDDTPSASSDTKAWIRDEIMPRKPIQAIAETLVPVVAAHGPENGNRNCFDEAMKLGESGNVSAAVEMISRLAAQEDSGRGRFQRQLELVRLFMATDHFGPAIPILQTMISEVERRGLLDWEDRSLIAQPLMLLVQCMDRTKRDPTERARIYDLLCRFEPASALQLEE